MYRTLFTLDKNTLIEQLRDCYTWLDLQKHSSTPWKFTNFYDSLLANTWRKFQKQIYVFQAHTYIWMHVENLFHKSGHTCTLGYPFPNTYKVAKMTVQLISSAIVCSIRISVMNVIQTNSHTRTECHDKGDTTFTWHLILKSHINLTAQNFFWENIMCSRHVIVQLHVMRDNGIFAF